MSKKPAKMEPIDAQEQFLKHRFLSNLFGELAKTTQLSGGQLEARLLNGMAEFPYCESFRFYSAKAKELDVLMREIWKRHGDIAETESVELITDTVKELQK